MFSWDGWEKIKVPLGWVAGGMLIAFSIYSYAENHYLKISEFKVHQFAMELRLLNQQKILLETDVLRLTVKRNIYPQQFDAVDKTILDRQERQLDETKNEIIRLERRYLRNGGDS